MSKLWSMFESNTHNTDHNENNSSEEKSMPEEGGLHDPLEDQVRPYIDLIDSLRLIGIEKELHLPAIAVIGDQSSGKSSVLEALSGVSLPRGTGIVTRCPLELKLRKIKSANNWKATISYKDHSIELNDREQVDKHIIAAQNQLAGEGVGICDDLITLEIMAPDVCDLTLIDLPGIARVPVKGQPDDIDKQIKTLIRKYVSKAETINLIVVACNVDIATTEALRMAQDMDPEGKRTLAILTKPDLIDKGTEKNILEIVRNEVPLSKGYVIVKCRGQEQINKSISLADAIKEEGLFFKNHKYFSCLLNEERATTKCLATKLTRHLVDHIKAMLPLLLEQVKKELWTKKKELSKFQNCPPLDLQKRKMFLISIFNEFNEHIKELTDGELVSDHSLLIRLRLKFDEWKKELDGHKPTFQNCIEDTVKKYNQVCRGMELPGFWNYNLFKTVVQKYVIELKNPALQMFTDISAIVEREFMDVIDSHFCNFPFLQTIVNNMIENIQSKQEARVKERIYELFEMEKIVYTQDDLYYKALGVPEEHLTPEASEEPDLYRKTYTDMFTAYYEIVVQRLADNVPMLILYFMLKESSNLVRNEVLNLLDGVNVVEILREEPEISRQRIEIENSIDRLTKAQEKLQRFF